MTAYNAQSSFNQYKENSVSNAKPEELTLMLFNGLVKFILRARESIQGGRIPEAHNNIVRAQDIVQEFIRTLDHNYEVAESMALVYDYLYRRLVDANMKKDDAILAEVLGFSTDLRDTWAKAMKLSRIPQSQTVPVASAQ